MIKEKYGDSYGEKFRQYEDRIKELEKENAELRKKLKPENCLKLLAKEGYIKFTSEHLTKAKELLKEWLQTSEASGCDNINIVTDTEQFLNSEVEK